MADRRDRPVRGTRPRQGLAAGEGPLPVVGARPAPAGRDRDPGRHGPAGLLRPPTRTTTATTRPVEVDLVDSIYYTTVTLSTTGYGDIAPVEPHARLINAFVITPLRIAFLVLLIGTTLEVLASQGREMFRVARWRKKMGEHVVVVGYGTKGRSAVETLVNNGQDPRGDRGGRHRCGGAAGRARRRPRRRHRRRHPARGAATGRVSPRPARSSSPPTATTPTCSPR